MIDNITNLAVKATAQSILDADADLNRIGIPPIPSQERITDPDPLAYISPKYLEKTAPHLSRGFSDLLDRLFSLNKRFAGELTIDVQAYLSLTGEHEELEESFLAWCKSYFQLRGTSHRLNASNNNDIWQLYQQCNKEYSGLIEERLLQEGTINSSVMNLSQRYMLSGFASSVLGNEVQRRAIHLPSKLLSEFSYSQASNLVCKYQYQESQFKMFFDQVFDSLPSDYSLNNENMQMHKVLARIDQCAEDLVFLRYLLPNTRASNSSRCNIANGMWANFNWDVYHGSVIATILTSKNEIDMADGTTMHLLGIRRGGWICHREYPWLRVDPENPIPIVTKQLATNIYLLDSLTRPLYDSWLALDTSDIIDKGVLPIATDMEQTAALMVAASEPAQFDDDRSSYQAKVVPRLRMDKIRKILEVYFSCEWSYAKGSEQKVYRSGAKHFTFGCHTANRQVHPVQLKKCLTKLGISIADFISRCPR